MKTCNRCNQDKPLSEFYDHAAMSDKHLNACKACVRDRVNKYRQLHLDLIRAKDRARGRRPERLKKVASNAYKYRHHNKAWRQRNPEKSRAHTRLRRAILAGYIKKMPCEVCGSCNSQAHHEDYSKPLEVRWFCFQHHKELHRKYSE